MTAVLPSESGKRVGAIVLAAGESSRMGQVKALLPLGAQTVLGRVLTTLRSAGVEQVVVVTGYHADSVVPAATALGAAVAPNAFPERGMFSSVQAGALALATHGGTGVSTPDAFFVLPVDYPLVRSNVLLACIEAFVCAEHDVVHPCCGGLRGHPPLLAADLLLPLADAPTGSDLRAFLASEAPREAEVEVDDITILLDMDTPDDLARLRRFAAHIDNPGGSEARLDEADASYLLTLLRTPENVTAHCRAVAEVGTALAHALHAHLPEIDAEVVRTGCMLHDMVRGQGARKHALMGERILRNLGLLRLADVVGGHMVLPHDPRTVEAISEEELVYLADKMVVEDGVAGLVGRERRALEKCGDDEASRRSIRARMQVAEQIAAKIEAVLGRSVDELVVSVDTGT